MPRLGIQSLAVQGLDLEGYVIVSADGMLANADHVMPDQLRFEGDKRFFTSALDRADLIVHGRNSDEDQPNAPRRKRLILSDFSFYKLDVGVRPASVPSCKQSPVPIWQR